ncbi:DNA binding transcription coactivator transcription factor [Mortierella sp. AD031]|nr:DNA binding transcription coactivator transcription factor [Mortierella sp. AD031]
MLASLRKKKSNLAQIQIYMPHQPVAAIESRLKELEASASQKPTFQRWTPQEDTRLGQAVRDLGTNRWNIQPGITAKTRRSPRSCQIRWKFLHSASSSHGDGYNAGPWSAEEVELFQELVDPNPTPESPNNWDAISQAIGTRSPIQCSSQFASVMHTGTKGKWTVDEINLLLEAHELYGRDWQKVSRHVGTRAPPQVRQKWNQFSEDVLRRLNARRQRSAAGSGVIGDDEK